MALAAAGYLFVNNSAAADALAAAQTENTQLQADIAKLKADGEKAKTASAALEAQLKTEQDAKQAATDALTEAQAKLAEKCVPAAKKR